MMEGAWARAKQPHSERRQKERSRKGPGTRYTLQRHMFCDLLPPTRPHHLIAHSAMNSSMDYSTDEVSTLMI
jgi:hypothetical protein